ILTGSSVMNTESIAVAAGLACGAVLLVLLYVLATRKAAKTGQRPVMLFLWALSFFALIHGVGLVVGTAVVLLGATMLFGPLPAEDRGWMWYTIRAGGAFVLVGGVGLLSRRGRWRPRPAPAAGPRPGGP